jgi:hypothetical protein
MDSVRSLSRLMLPFFRKMPSIDMSAGQVSVMFAWLADFNKLTHLSHGGNDIIDETRYSQIDTCGSE